MAELGHSLQLLNCDTGSTLLRGLVDTLLRQLQEVTRDSRTSAGGWQEAAAAAVTVLMEVLYGASAAWDGADTLRVVAAGSGAFGARMLGARLSCNHEKLVLGMELRERSESRLFVLHLLIRKIFKGKGLQ